MKTTIIITSREPNTKAKRKKDICELISGALETRIDNGSVVMTSDVISIKQRSWVDISYNLIELDKSIMLELSTPRENKDSIMAHECLWESITKTPLRKDVNIQKVFDEPSHILCVRLFKPLALFERNLRKLVYEIVTKVYGGEWYKKTIEAFVNHCEAHDALSKVVKKNARKDKLKEFEAALEEMTYSNLITYLFDKTTLIPYATFIEEYLSDDKLQNYSKDEIILLIQTNRSQSLWERIFGAYDRLKDLPLEILKIQEYRNKVMHSKTVYYSEYKELNHLLEKWNPLIESACRENESRIYNSELNYSAIYSLPQVTQIAQSISKVLRSSIPSVDLEGLFDVSSTISESMRSIMNAYTSSIDFSSLLAPFVAFGDILFDAGDNIDNNNADDNSSSDDDSDDQ